MKCYEMNKEISEDLQGKQEEKQVQITLKKYIGLIIRAI